ncbi:MAG TPA: LacI family DNA-binding transcriptional regulator [Puia sp.]|nr:LacI family DNA-binding transcriptional regulator [Puia sp.]
MENSKDITIYDIAKNLNVSPSTVSRALKDDPTVNKLTKKKVFEKAAEMGYRSNQFAKNLRQQSTMTIGVMASELNAGITTSVLAGIERVANEAGYGIIITDSAQSPMKETANAANLFQRRVDGVIASIAPGTDNLDHFRHFSEKKIPVIFLDRAARLADSTSVLIDNALCGYMATKHLIDQGCRRIAHITSDIQHVIFSQRYNGYLDALKESKIVYDISLLLIAAPTEEASEAAAKQILSLDPLPDGVFVTDDFAAAVLIRAFLEKGIRVPQDIAVVGFNNDVIGRLIKPTLSTVNYPGKEVGETAARILIDRLKGTGNIGSISTVTVRAEMVIRQSSMRKG